MADKHGSRDFRLSELSDEQLHQLLHEEMEADEPDTALVRRVAAVLTSREEANGHEVDENAAWETIRQYQEDGPPLFPEVKEELDGASAGVAARKHVRHTRLFRVAVAAAIILALLLGATAVADAAGLSLWGMLTHWTADTFGLAERNLDISSDHLEHPDFYYHLRRALQQEGAEQDLVPTLVPDGYSVSQTNTEQTYEGAFVFCALSNGDNEIIFNYIISNLEQPNQYYPIDEIEPEVYTVNGIDHYIMTNEGEYVVSWTNGNVRCDITGVPNHEELIKIIDSIYVGRS